MRTAFALLMACFSFSMPARGDSQPVPKLDQILPRIQAHVAEFERSLPDFVCDETITSRELMGGKVQHETIIDSSFRGTQNKDAKDRAFTESREVLTVDGRPAARGQQLAGPFLFGGGFSSLLDAIFSERNARYFTYKVQGAEKIDDRDTVVVRFATRQGQKELLHRDILGGRSVLKGRGKAWIDPVSANVVRLELEYLDPPALDGVLTVSVDYAEVVINEKKFWMPRTVKADQTVPNPHMPVTGQYIAQYSNYHQFNVSVKMKF